MDTLQLKPRNQKSAMRSLHKFESIFKKTLSFKPKEDVALADRDYGFLRVTSDKSATPYPRVEVGVDADLLNARLKVEQQFQPLKKAKSTTGSEITLRMRRSVHVSAGLGPNAPEHMLIGTPHPRKGTVINPHNLLKRLNERYLKDDSSSTMGLHSSGSIMKRSKSTRDTSLASAPSKRHVTITNKSDRVNIPTEEPEPLALKKVLHKDALLSHVSSTTTYQSVTLYDVRDHGSEASQSFSERRRQFYEAEFTIAKNGKKMSDFVMALPLHIDTDVKGEWDDNDIKAQYEIESFIRKQGLLKKSHDRLINVPSRARLLDETSLGSTPSTATIQSNVGQGPA